MTTGDGHSPNPAASRTLAITGGAGFIGSAVARAAIAAGWRVRVLDATEPSRWWRLANEVALGSVDTVRVDLRQAARCRDALEGADAVVHLAAATEMHRSADDPRRDVDVSIKILLNVLDAVSGEGKRLVFASSSAVYGMAATVAPARESGGPLLPISIYGAAKLAGEGLVSAYSHVFGFDARIVRLGTIVGSQMDHGAVASFVAQASTSGRISGLGDGRQARPFLHASCCADAVLHVLDIDDARCEVFNVAPGTVTTTRDIAIIVCEELGLDEHAVTFAGTTRGWVGDVPVVALDVSKLAAAGWASATTSDEAVRRAVRELAGRVNLRPSEPNTAAPTQIGR